MKNKRVLLTIIGIIIVSSILTVIIKNNTKEYIMYEGNMIALTIDGTPATSFPNSANKYNVDIECDGGVGEYLPIKEDNYNYKLIIKNITKEGVKCDVDFTTITDSNKNNYLLKTRVESDNTTNNNGYRYSGKQPNNWVWFNNELWRIIGSIPVCTTSGCGTSNTRLVKIIRAESIGGLAYDAQESGYTGVWGSNTLYTLLNNYYYGKTNGTGTNYCYGYNTPTYHPVPNCNYTNIGISSIASDYYGRMVKNVYWNTGASSNSGTVSSVYTSETATQTVSGKIGLMTASDYGYATSGTVHLTAPLSNLSANTNNNWLYGQGNEWTSICNSSTYLNSLIVTVAGSVAGQTASSARVVRPVLYLDSNVYIISGKGTESNPYILGM